MSKHYVLKSLQYLNLSFKTSLIEISSPKRFLIKHYVLMALSIVLLQACSTTESVLLLGPSQSMSITGKGKGQDAAINPYLGENCLAIVKNLGDNKFEARVQRNGEIVKTIVILPKEKQEIELMKGSELYFDGGILESKAKVKFKKFEK